MSRRNVSVFAMVLLAASLALPVDADIVGEGVTALRCTEADDLTMPKKMEFMQTVLADDFEDYDQVVLAVEAELDGAVEPNRGQIIATVFLIEPDGTVTKLGRVKAKFQDGDAFKLKLVDATIEKGDLVHWKIKTKRLPELLAELDDCFNLYLFVAVADGPVD